jgi:hypothetical protein
MEAVSHLVLVDLLGLVLLLDLVDLLVVLLGLVLPLVLVHLEEDLVDLLGLVPLLDMVHLLGMVLLLVTDHLEEILVMVLLLDMVHLLVLLVVMVLLLVLRDMVLLLVVSLNNLSRGKDQNSSILGRIIDKLIMYLLQMFHLMSNSYLYKLLMHSDKPTLIETVN